MIHHARIPPAKLTDARLRADNVADSDQGRRERGRRPGDPAAFGHVADGRAVKIEMMDHRSRKAQESVGVFTENLEAFVARQNLKEASERHRSENQARGIGLFGAIFRACADDLHAGDTLGPR